MDNDMFFKEAKKLAVRQLQKDLEMAEKTTSIDDLMVLLFGVSYSNLAGFHICKKHVCDKDGVTKVCAKIQDDYLTIIKSSD